LQAQRQNSTIADSTACWIDLLDKLPSHITSSDYFKKQFKLGVTAVSIAAMILSPKYKGMKNNNKTVKL